MYWTTGSGRIELNLTKAQAHIGHHQGECDADIKHLKAYPRIWRQLDKIDPEVLAQELQEYGAWSIKELGDHQANLERLLWIACGDICDGNI